MFKHLCHNDEKINIKTNKKQQHVIHGTKHKTNIYVPTLFKEINSKIKNNPQVIKTQVNKFLKFR